MASRSASDAEACRGRTALVSGASSGIGRALALQLGRAGARVGLVARRAERLEALAREIRAAGGESLVLPGDVADAAFCRQAVERVAERFGGLELVVPAAGVSMHASFEASELEVFHRLMDVNYFGSLHFAKFALPHLERSRGSLVFVSSVVGKRGFATRSGYAAAKFALQGLFESLRVEWRPKGVHVGLVCPGYTDTEIRATALGPDGKPTPEAGGTLGTLMSAEAAAAAILRTADRRQRERVLTLGGKLVVWLNRLAPGLVDRVAGRLVG